MAKAKQNGIVVTADSKGKGKQVELASAQDDALSLLADSITARADLLAPGRSDATLLEQSLAAVKASFDTALRSEAIAFGNLGVLLQTMSSSSAGPSTRSKASAASLLDEPSPPKLEPTPLAELTTDGMELEMVWEQMEMRNGAIVQLLEDMFGGPDGADEDGSGASGSDEDGDSEEGDPEEDVETDEGGSESSSSEEESEDQEENGQMDGPGYTEHEEYVRQLELGSDAAEPDSDEDADPTKNLSLSTFDKPGSGQASRRAPGPPSAVDDDFFSLHDFHVAVDEGEFEMDRAMRGEMDEEDEDEDVLDLFAPVESLAEDDDEEADDDGEEEAEDNLDQANIMYKDFFDPPPRPITAPGAKGGNRRGKKMTADKHTSKTDAKAKSADLTPSSNGDVAVAAPPTKRKRSVRFSGEIKVKTIAARRSEFDKLVEKVGWEKAASIFGEKEGKDGDLEAMETEMAMTGDDDSEQDDEEDHEEGGDAEEDEDEEDGDMDVEMDDGEGSSASEEDEGLETIERLKTSLFDEDEDEEGGEVSKAAALSRHERRLLALSSQIAALEAENVGPKDWATKGEAKARDRPVNSLLEEDLEYERAGKVVPVITEETTKTIEDLIRKRILDNDFDDVVRRRPVDPNAFLPSRFMELQDTKSNKSLAEIYEEDYTTSKEKEAGRTVVNELDADLEKKHAEIEELFEDLSSKLDALSNARFTPKPPKATITTISNVPSVSLESALPTTTSTATLLAPEEVFVPDPTNEDRSDFTPAQKKAARQKRRKARASMAQAAEKFSKGSKGEKERATKQLLGTRGVTVLGKGGAAGKEEKSLKRKRPADDEGKSAVMLKL